MSYLKDQIALIKLNHEKEMPDIRKQLWGLISLIGTMTSARKRHVAHVCKIYVNYVSKYKI
ncbi:MAG: hypothetical protein E6L03_01890 [Thaumarchaeota archaeon]|nr:MAG: hypothetical protein E6L03_01890 [Nitrososphaerota archaeon]